MSLRHRHLNLSPSFLRRQESIPESHAVSQTRKMDSRIRENDGKEGVVRRVTTVPARRHVAPPLTYRFVTDMSPPTDISLCHRHSCAGRNPSSNPMPCRRPGRWIPAFARMTGKKGLSGALPPSRLADKSPRHRHIVLSPTCRYGTDISIRHRHSCDGRNPSSNPLPCRRPGRWIPAFARMTGKKASTRPVTTVPTRRHVAPSPTSHFVTVIPAKAGIHPRIPCRVADPGDGFPRSRE